MPRCFIIQTIKNQKEIENQIWLRFKRKIGSKKTMVQCAEIKKISLEKYILKILVQIF